MNQNLNTFFLNLLACPSITPKEAGCMQLIRDYLKDIDALTIQDFIIGDTHNLYITHGKGAPHISLVGHIDVVPAGDLNDWHSPPFSPTIRDGKVYARGASDMKSGVAALVDAFKTIISQHQNKGTLSLLITSDEEGDATDGIQAVLPLLKTQNIHIDYAIVGEPTSDKHLGDYARNGRRGSLNLQLTIEGKQGHVAYPEKVKNPIHGLSQILSTLSQITWDNGNQNFPPTSFQISNLKAGEGATNVVPQRAEAKMNWRFNTEHSAESLQQKAQAIIDPICQAQQLTAHYHWHCSGHPFATNNPILLNALKKAVAKHTKQNLIFNTAGGTSDARFLAQFGADTIEFGVSNATIHQINEHIELNDLEPLSKIYQDTIKEIFKNSHA